MTAESARIDELVNRVKQLKRLGRYTEAETALLAEVQRWEADGTGVAPWYYEQLAIICRKQGRIDDEIAILKRFERQPKLPGAGPEILQQRLAKARNFAGEAVEADAVPMPSCAYLATQRRRNLLRRVRKNRAGVKFWCSG